MEDIFKVVAFDWFLRIKQVEEVLNELGCNVHFETAHFNRLVDDKL